MSTAESNRTDGKKTTAETVVSVGVASGAFLAAAPTRTAFVICPPPTNAVTISSLATAILSQGIIVRPTDAPFIVRIEDFGAAVTGAWTAIGSVGAQNVEVFDIRSTAG